MPVLVVPQVAIGALGRIQTVPRYVSKNTLLPATVDEIHRCVQLCIDVTN